MDKYRLAFFTADWNYELVETTLYGLKRFVDEHENVSICVFDCFGKDEGTEKDKSEYNIFNLADLKQFDGLIVQGNQIVLGSVREEISRRVVTSGIPAVSIDCPMKGCALINIDNEQAQYEITAHVIQRHEARRLVYLTGIMENGCPEGQQRMDGFLSACRDNDIAESDIEVIPCSWRTSDGAETVERWLASGKPLPDAFICGNDEMALGMMERLEDHGFAIPRDVIVTGFDNISSAELSTPRLSTINRDYEQLIYLAAETVINRIEGRDHRDEVVCDHNLVASESCGCRGGVQSGYIRGRYFRQTRFLKDFYMFQDRMAEELLEAGDLLELMDIVERNHSIFGCDSVYLCINDYYYDNYDRKQWRNEGRTFGAEMILAACMDGGEQPVRAHRYARFPTRSLLPGDILQKERFLVFYPLHYNTSSIGYIALNGISQAAKLNLHKSIFNFVEIAVENVRKKGLLKELNDELDDLYVRDAMTGFYNRFGLERYGQQVFERFLSSDGLVQIMFIDMDDMKGINDRFGHEMGDMAIRATADVLRQASGSDDFLMRYGGDEFLLIASGREGYLQANIESAVEARRDRTDTPFRLSLSIGIVRVDRADPRTLDECIVAADALMYDIKNQKKKH